MLRTLGWLIKLTLFSVAVLLAGDAIHWNGKTLSQHVRTQVTQAGRSDTASYVRGLTRKVTEDARAGFDKKVKQLNRAQNPVHASIQNAPSSPGATNALSSEDTEITDRTEMEAAAPSNRRMPEPNSVRTVARTEEPIPPSERQKLRALIHELNSSHD